MVSLLELAEITEEGVKFKSPHDGSEMMLTPEHSIEIQNSIGADIMMQLDDVVSSTTTGLNLCSIYCYLFDLIVGGSDCPCKRAIYKGQTIRGRLQGADYKGQTACSLTYPNNALSCSHHGPM